MSITSYITKKFNPVATRTKKIPGFITTCAKNAFEGGKDFVEGKLPIWVPRDKPTSALVSLGIGAFIVDRSPFPIGESIALTCVGLATLRGAIINRDILIAVAKDTWEPKQYPFPEIPYDEIAAHTIYLPQSPSPEASVTGKSAEEVWGPTFLIERPGSSDGPILIPSATLN